MRFRRGLKIEKGWIDFVPFINVVLLLNIFFILTSSLVFQPGIKVDVPLSGFVDFAAEKDIVIVTIARDNRIFMREKKVNGGQLRQQMKKLAKTSPNTLIIIKADSNIKHDRVIDLMDIIISSGMKRISIAASPKK